MTIEFRHMPHPHVAARKMAGPPKSTDQQVGLNGRIGLVLTTVAFALLALLVLPQAAGGGLLAFVQWLSQTFIQLVMLSVIMVGQNILSRAADKRSEMTYQDAEATLHEAEQIQAHLKVQDEAMNVLLDKIARLEVALAAS
jgi:predicted DNA repair protein MutK